MVDVGRHFFEGFRWPSDVDSNIVMKFHMYEFCFNFIIANSVGLLIIGLGDIFFKISNPLQCWWFYGPLLGLVAVFSFFLFCPWRGSKSLWKQVNDRLEQARTTR